MGRADDQWAFLVGERADRGIPIATVMDWDGHGETKMVMHDPDLRIEAARTAIRRLRAGGASKRSWPTQATG